MALVLITKAIFGNENSVLTVSAMLSGESGQNRVYVGVPCVANRNGVRRVLEMNLTEEEQKKLDASCDTRRESFDSLKMD